MQPNSSPPGRRAAPWILLVLAGLFASLWLALARIGDPVEEPPVRSSPSDGPASAESAHDPSTALAPSDRASAAEVSAPAPMRSNRARSGTPDAKSERWAGGVITGRVLGGPGASEPIAGIGVRAIAPRSTFAIPERRTRTDALGRYELRDLVAAHWEIEAALPAIDLRGASTVDLDEEKLPEAVVDVLLPYERHVDVRLVDARGNPITAVALGLDPVFLPLLCVGVARACKDSGAVLGPADMPLNRIVDRSPKGERHTFEVVIQAAGAECLHVLFVDRVIASRALARDDARVDILLDRADVARFLGPCTVQVVAAGDGTPLAAAKVGFRGPGVRVLRDTDADGIARLEGVPFGAIQTSAEAPGYVARTVGVDVPREAPLRIELLPARRIEGRIAVEGGRDPSPFLPGLWRVRDPAAKLGEPLMRMPKRGRGGEFSLESLEPGLYVVAAVPGSLALHTGEDVKAGKAQAAAWVDLTRGDALGVDLLVPSWMDP
ncbi:MAG: carboxypeptidase-like regulatory domain-containing protein [Planctomycetota bacterium]|nr:carboxypeptidase-like regulatory domain-containing protein [Planctomycetota bacterium]